MAHQTNYPHIKINLLLINSIYFVFFFSGNPKKNLIDWNILRVLLLKQLFFLKQLWKTFSPVCMLLAQIASENVFYSMWVLENIVFYKGVCFFYNCYLVGFFQPPCSCFLWNKWFERNPYFDFYVQNTNTKVTKVPKRSSHVYHTYKFS